MSEDEVQAEQMAAEILRNHTAPAAPATPLPPMPHLEISDTIFDEDYIATHQTAIRRVLYALAEPVRLEIVMYLRVHAATSAALVACLELAPSTITHHLQILERAGIICSVKVGRTKNITLAGDVSGLLEAALRVVTRQP